MSFGWPSYGPQDMRQCRCGGWYGPTEASREAHRIALGHRPVQVQVQVQADPEPDPEESDGPAPREPDPDQDPPGD